MEMVKLIYLSDREALDRFGFPITWDQPVAMQHGPVPTETYNCIKGERGQCGTDWPQLVSPKSGPQNRDLRLVRNIEIDELDELSEAEVEILEAIWGRFGHMTAAQLRDWTHDNCPEWVDPGRTSVAIRYEDIFKALGKKRSEISALVSHINEQLAINACHAHA